MPKRKNHFIIKGTIYPFDILVCFGIGDSELKKIIKPIMSNETYRDTINTEDFILGLHHTVRARTAMTESNQTMIRFSTKRPAPGVIAHEVFHASCFILEKVGLKCSIDSNEAYAYLIEHITDKIYEFLKLK